MDYSTEKVSFAKYVHFTLLDSSCFVLSVLISYKSNANVHNYAQLGDTSII